MGKSAIKAETGASGWKRGSSYAIIHQVFDKGYVSEEPGSAQICSNLSLYDTYPLHEVRFGHQQHSSYAVRVEED